MNFRAIFYYLGWFCIPVTGMATLVICFSYFIENKTGVGIYYLIFLLSGVFFFLSRALKVKKQLTKMNLLIFIFIGWLLYPLVIGIPYYFSYYQLNFFLSYYEAVSGFLGFGLSVFNRPEILNDSLLLWRSGSQWIGGFYYLFTIFAILSTLDINFIPSRYISTASNSLNFENKFVKNFLNIFYCYFLFSLFVLLFLNFTSLNFFEKLNLMMTIVSSGGFFIKEQLIVMSKLDSIIISLCFLLSALNIFIFYELFRFGKNYNFKEDLSIIILAFVVAFSLLFIFATTDNFYDIFLFVTTSLSTSGIALPVKSNFLYINIFLILTFVGGSIYSTGSGFKLLRILFFIKKFLIEVTKLLSPSTIVKKNIFNSQEPIKNSDYYIASLIFVFYGVIFLSACLLISFDNLGFEDVYKLAFLSMNNTLPYNYLSRVISFYDLSYLSHSVILLLVFASKVYFVSFLVVVKKLLWK